MNEDEARRTVQDEQAGADAGPIADRRLAAAEAAKESASGPVPLADREDGSSLPPSFLDVILGRVATPESDGVADPIPQPNAASLDNADEARARGNEGISKLMAHWEELRLEPPQHPVLSGSTAQFLATAGLVFGGSASRACENAVALAAAVSAASAGIVEARYADWEIALDLHVVVAGSACGLGRPVLQLAQACDAAREDAYASRVKTFERLLRYHEASLALQEVEGYEAEGYGAQGHVARRHDAQGHGTERQGPQGRGPAGHGPEGHRPKGQAPADESILPVPVAPSKPGPSTCMSGERRDIEKALAALPDHGGLLLYTPKTLPALGLPVQQGRTPFAVEAVEASALGEPIAGRIVRISTIGLAPLPELLLWAEGENPAPAGTIFLADRRAKLLPDLPPAASVALSRIARLETPVRLHIGEHADIERMTQLEKCLAEALAKRFGNDRPSGAIAGLADSVSGLGLRLACICHLLAWACDAESGPVPPEEVRGSAITAGGEWARALVTYALVLLGDAVAPPDLRSLRVVERTVNEPKFDGTFTLSTLSSRLRPMLDGGSVRYAVERLLKQEILKAADAERKPGRPPLLLRRARRAAMPVAEQDP